jgi:hypothetical protein
MKINTPQGFMKMINPKARFVLCYYKRTLRAVESSFVSPRVEKQQGITCLLLGVRRVASFVGSMS